MAGPALARSSLTLLPPASGDVTRARERRRARESSRPGDQEITRILDTVKRLTALRDQWRGLLRDAYELFLPQKNAFVEYTEGAQRGREVLDSTPQKALKRWASRKQQAMLPPGRKFVRLVAGSATPEEIKDEADKMLEAETDKLFGELNQSNMATTVAEAMLDAGIWQGAFMVQDGGEDDSLRFSSVPPDEILCEDGPHGECENVYRTRCVAIGMLERTWVGYDLSPQSAQQVRDKPEAKVDIVEATVYRPKQKQWLYAVIEVKAKHVGFWQLMDDTPYVVFGATKLSRETSRRGPALDALADAKTLNRVKELTLRNAALAVSGVYLGVDDGVLDVWNTVFAPGGIIPVLSSESLSPLETSHKFDVAQIIIADLQQSIMEAMEALDLGRIEETPVRTATEVAVRDQQIAADSASSSARLQTELVLQVVKKSVRILRQRGILADMEVDGRDVDVEFEGPLARAQDAEELQRADLFLAGVAGFGPEAIGIAIDPVEFIKRYAEKAGVWRGAIRTDEDVKKIQKQAAAAAQQMAQAQMQQGAGQ